MRELILNITKKEEWGIIPSTIYNIEVSSEFFKDFQMALIKWLGEDIDVFFNLD